jgi:hypothetical protein
MKITPDVFKAYLKCPTKCWLRAAHHPPAGSVFSEWVKAQDDSYRSTERERLIAQSANGEVALSPDIENIKAAKWRLALSLAVQAKMDSCVLECELHALERVPAKGRGKPVEFVPIRFVFTNKLGTDEKLLLAFDAFVLSKFLGRQVSIGKIIHGNEQATMTAKPSLKALAIREKKIHVLGNPQLKIEGTPVYLSRCRRVAGSRFLLPNRHAHRKGNVCGATQFVGGNSRGREKDLEPVP